MAEKKDNRKAVTTKKKREDNQTNTKAAAATAKQERWVAELGNSCTYLPTFNISYRINNYEIYFQRRREETIQFH
jgi:hypothetical protein